MPGPPRWCDVLVVGGGPAGSTCAWALRRQGADVVVMDRAVFPRDKPCAGWITPPVVEALELDVEEYRDGRVFQPVTGFLTSVGDGRARRTHYGSIVSYGIRRRELDAYLLRRSGARVLEGEALRGLRRVDGGWIANDALRARVVVGAGGHFCPVARALGAVPPGEAVVVAQEVEFRLDARQQLASPVRGEEPELYFCRDLKGYGWCVRKEDVLNVGLGRLDPHGLSAHVRAFASFLRRRERLPADAPERFAGHAYLVASTARRPLVHDGALLVGDAAGLAYAASGEGIRPAVESGLLAARTIVAAGGRGSAGDLAPYADAVAARLGPRGHGVVLPQSVASLAGRGLLASGWATRRIVLDRWFLHAGQRALDGRVDTPARTA